MNLRLDNEGCYLRAVVQNGTKETVVRRWPWPNNPQGQYAKWTEARAYCLRLADVMACAVDIRH